MSVLIVWEETPEGCKFYLVDEGSEAHQLAVESNDLFINGDSIPDGHALYELNDLLAELNNSEMPIESENITSVYYCGFLL